MAVDKEVLDRLRRIETRLTTFMISQGYDPGGNHPRWDGAALHIPSTKVALQDMLDAIPDGVASAPLWIEGDYLATLTNFGRHRP